jgi:hypothetical protein
MRRIRKKQHIRKDNKKFTRREGGKLCTKSFRLETVKGRGGWQIIIKKFGYSEGNPQKAS